MAILIVVFLFYLRGAGHPSLRQTHIGEGKRLEVWSIVIVLRMKAGNSWWLWQDRKQSCAKDPAWFQTTKMVTELISCRVPTQWEPNIWTTWVYSAKAPDVLIPFTLGKKIWNMSEKTMLVGVLLMFLDWLLCLFISQFWYWYPWLWFLLKHTWSDYEFLSHQLGIHISWVPGTMVS